MNSLAHEDVILVVEDDEDLREGLCDLLEAEGYRAVGVFNGLEALQYLRAHRLPCVILLDLMMPGMSGGEFRARQLADAMLARVPTIVVSAMDLNHQQAQVLNAAGYLSKPVSVARLSQTVRQHCQGTC
ncbi:MAG TPA: response regulator [Archangium sp.]|nr:response regulator [Archangium sp.]